MRQKSPVVGGATAAFSVAENSIAVTTVAATDREVGQSLVYSINGGADATLFTIDETTGVLSFITAPDFEAPADTGSDNTYDVTVQVSDGNGGSDAQDIAVTVTNVAGIAPPASNAATITGTGEEDVLTGLNGANMLQGLGGNDILTGNGGNDTLDGGLGHDIMSGGAGADTLNGGQSNDTATGGTGNDTVNGGQGNDTLNYVIGDGADTVDGGGDLDTLNITGTAANNTLNVIFDGTALSNFEGGTVANVETFVVDLLGGTDTLNYTGTTANITVDFANGSASGFTSIAGIENVTPGPATTRSRAIVS
jgi:Ca2+-binding RTX toxin-like protein